MINATSAKECFEYWSTADIQNFSVEQLDSYCQALVMLTNYDTNVLLNYKNMRVINDSNEFDYDLEWLSTAGRQIPNTVIFLTVLGI